MIGRDRQRSDAEFVVLSMLAEGPKYGYLLTKQATARSHGKLRLTAGALYPLLKSLESQGLLKSSWEEVKADGAATGEAGRGRKWYRLSAKGRRRLEARIADHMAYRAFFDAVIDSVSVKGLGTLEVREGGA